MKLRVTKRFKTIAYSVTLFGLMSCSITSLSPVKLSDGNLSSSQNLSSNKPSSINKNSITNNIETKRIVKAKSQKVIPKEDIILRDTPEVRKYLSMYTGRSRKDIEIPLQRRSKYISSIEKVLNYFELPLDLSNLALIESKFDSSARSPQGALGLWQFMKPTAEELGLKCNFWNDEREDVLRSSIAAAKYLKDLQNRFDDWLLALAAYNAGPGRILSAIEKSGGEKDFYKLASMELLPQETVNHVSRFIAVSMIVRNPDIYEFADAKAPLIGDVSVED